MEQAFAYLSNTSPQLDYKVYIYVI